MSTAGKSPKNKTLNTPLAEGGAWLDQCIRIDAPVTDIAPLADATVCGNFLEIAPLLPRGFADLIIADPPYNRNRDFGDGAFQKMTNAEYAAYTRRWVELAVPLLRDNGSMYVCCDWQSSLIVGPVLAELLHVRSRITWQREKGRGAKANWKNAHEDIWFATKGAQYTFHLDAVRVRRRVVAPYRKDGQPKDWHDTTQGRFRDTCPSNFWDDITVPFWSMPENTAHPAQKPEKLMAKILLASTNPGDMVFDPFLGSGSSSVAARKLGRRFLGIEVNPQYCVWARQRLDRAEADAAIQGFVDGVFWERNELGRRAALEEEQEQANA